MYPQTEINTEANPQCRQRHQHTCAHAATRVAWEPHKARHAYTRRVRVGPEPESNKQGINDDLMEVREHGTNHGRKGKGCGRKQTYHKARVSFVVYLGCPKEGPMHGRLVLING